MTKPLSKSGDPAKPFVPKPFATAPAYGQWFINPKTAVDIGIEHYGLNEIERIALETLVKAIANPVAVPAETQLLADRLARDASPKLAECIRDLTNALAAGHFIIAAGRATIIH